MLPAILAVSLALGAVPSALAQQSPIEGLAPPTPQAPPQDPSADQDAQLDAKREGRAKRDAETEPLGPSPDEKRRAALRQEALAEHPLDLLMEISLVFGSALTTGDKGGYTVDPSSHVSLALRKKRPVAGVPEFFYGARIAPFSGSGYFKAKPGRYGLTFFGPIVGVGRIDPVPPRGGPFSGWLVTGGIAAVAKAGSSATAPLDRNSDFATKGLAFEAPGLWIEGRWLRILYGALGYDVVFGAQYGSERSLLYGGVAAAAWR